jgi:hypothetical protein
LEEHKFGFGKVMVVADYENIQNLYHYRYGPDTDFGGYIDKFYSKEVFVFNNDQNLCEFIRNEISLNLEENDKKTLSFLLAYFVTNKKIKLRNIIKYNRTQLSKSFEIKRISLIPDPFNYLYFADIPHVKLSGNAIIESQNIPVLSILRCLVDVFGSVENLNSAIQFMRQDHQIMDEKSLDDLLISFVLFQRIIDSEGNPFNLLLKDYKHDGKGAPVVDDNYPEVQLLNRNYLIGLYWNSGRKYKGEGCFYQNSRIGLVGRTVQRDSRYELFDGEKIRYSDLALILQSHMTYITSNDLHLKMNISSH